MNPLDFVERLFSGIGSIFSRIGSLYRQGSDTAKKPWLRRIVVTLILLVVLAGLVFLGLALLPLVPMRFWQVLALCLVALVVLWWFMAGQRKASLKGRTRKRIGDLGPGNAEDEREPLQKMGAAIAEAKRTIARSPEMDKGRNPLYRIPWLLFVGDQAADVDGLLRAGCEVSPFPPPDKDEMDADDVWRWWFFKSMIGIEMHPRVVCDPSARLDRGLWYQALMKLADEREKLAILEAHARRMDAEARPIATAAAGDELAHGSFFAPRAYELKSLSQLQREVFGPVLHVLRWKADQLDAVIEQINATGYGLTLGIHSRIDETVDRIAARARVGNVYVNRNQIGAVVGVQPFGGQGLSGTGPKAGGPHYLPRFATEKTVTVNTTAAGGNASLLTLGD